MTGARQASTAIPDLPECQWAGGMKMTAGVVPALVKVGEWQSHKMSTQAKLADRFTH